jgi:phosphonopyruvate decarboxylase
MGVNFCILPTNISKAKEVVVFAKKYMQETKKPYAILVQKNSFDSYKLQTKKQPCSDLSREEAICLVAKELKATDVVISTTGHISRELYEFRKNNNQPHSTDFLCVGSMGHASSIATAIAIEKPNKNIFCFDGDGALLMHMGAMPVIAAQNLLNFKHIVFNNQAHDSVGGQPTCFDLISATEIAKASGYKKAYSVSTAEEMTLILPEFLSEKETALLEIKVKCGARLNLGRPKEKPCENKEMFMKNLSRA